MKLIFIVSSLFLFISCGSMTYTVKNKTSNVPLVKLSPNNKNIFISYLPQDCDNKIKLCNAFRYNLLLEGISNELTSWNKFKSVRNHLANLKDSVSLMKKADYILQVKVEEQNPHFDSVCSRILRTLSLGFYGQEVESSIVVKILLLDVKKKKYYTGEKVYQLDANYKLRGIMYPFNLNKKLEFAEDQAKLYTDLTKPILDKIFNHI